MVSSKIVPFQEPPPPGRLIDSDSDEGDNEENDEEVMRLDQRGIITRNIEPYADDRKLYKPRINKNSRLEYWAEILTQIKSKRKKIKGFATWRPAEQESIEEYNDFPLFYVYLVHFITSSRWDQFYLNWLLLWLILFILKIDFSSNIILQKYITINILFIPPLGMILCQLLPTIGTVYLICRCNDLLRHAGRRNCIHWSICSVLLAQYFEYFYFGGIKQ